MRLNDVVILEIIEHTQINMVLGMAKNTTFASAYRRQKPGIIVALWDVDNQ